MNKPSDILNRLNVEKVRNCVIWGREERGEPDPRSYDERLDEARQRVEACLASAAEQPGGENGTAEALQALLDTAKDVYTAVGIRVGAELAEQKLCHERRGKGGKDY